MAKHNIHMTDSELVVETNKRILSVKDADMRAALLAFAEVLHEPGRPTSEVERQVSKMVQFGLYDSEKDQADISTLAVAALARVA